MRLQIRRDTDAAWTAADPVLALGELALTTDTKELRIGDGVSSYSTLTPIQGGVAQGSSGYSGTGMSAVASGTNTNPGTSAQWLTYGSQFSRLHHAVTAVKVTSVRLIYANWMISNAAPIQLDNANQISFRAAIEVGTKIPAPYRIISGSTAYSAITAYAVGDQVVYSGTEYTCIQAGTGHTPATGSAYWSPIKLYPVHFSGEAANRDVTLQGGGIAISDPIVINPGLTRGQVFYSRTYVAPNNGTANTGNTPRTWYGYAASGFYEKHSNSGSAGTDCTLVAPTGAGDWDNTASFGPIAVIGHTTDVSKPIVFVIGDSFVFGTGDTSALFGDEFGGYPLRLLMDNPAAPTRFNYSFIRSGKGSSVGVDQTGSAFDRRLSLAESCTHVLDQFIVNDLGTASTLATIQAAALARWTAYANLGLTVYAVTSTPKTTSTDNWATIANQTPATSFGPGSKWEQYNTWVRTVPAPLAGVIDAAAVVTDPTTGVWIPAYVYTTDSAGVHPNTAGYIKIATEAPLYLASDPSTPITVSAARMFGAP